MARSLHTLLLQTWFLLFTLMCFGQTQPSSLAPDRPVTFSLSPGESRSFFLEMSEGDYAEINWLANETVILAYGFLDPFGKAVQIGDSASNEAAVFIAPTKGRYTFVIGFDASPEVKDRQNVSIEYKNSFKLPAGSKQKEIRKINGYDVRIIFAPEGGEEFGENIVVLERAGKLKKVLRASGNATYIGFSFTDKLKATKLSRSEALIRNTLDKTGDGVPDIMIDYYSGGAHCCQTTYFINLGETADVAQVINTEHSGLTAVGLNPKGGLRFETNENNFAYWNISFAGSPMPRVILEFVGGEMKPNFDLMKKPAPSLVTLRSKARAARLKITNEPYSEFGGGGFEDAFWSEMLDLIYTGNEVLAWQFFDLVWPTTKPGKDLFRREFVAQLATTYYGTKAINTGNSLRSFMLLFEKSLRENK